MDESVAQVKGSTNTGGGDMRQNSAKRWRPSSPLEQQDSRQRRVEETESTTVIVPELTILKTVKLTFSELCSMCCEFHKCSYPSQSHEAGNIVEQVYMQEWGKAASLMLAKVSAVHFPTKKEN